MSFPRYPKYKPSGVEWLGDVPEHWDVGTVGQRYQIRVGKMLDSAKIIGTHLKPYLRVADVQWEGINTDDLPEMDFDLQAQEKFRLIEGDLLVNEGGSYVGRSAIWRGQLEECYYQKALHRLRPLADGEELSAFFYYVMVFATHFGVFVAGGNHNTIEHLPAESFRNYRFTFPPKAEQHAIASFLDRETSKIDGLVGEQRRLIELLKEKRQAVISHAVTIGLNPHAPLKPSGIEWLGDVPEHWEVVALKRIASVQTGVAKGKDLTGQTTITVPYLRVANVQDGYLDLDEVALIQIPADELDRYRLQPGDVLMNEGGDFDKLGRGHVWDGQIDPCITQNHVFAVRPKSVASHWLNTITSSDYAQFYFMSRSKQSTNLASISSTNLMELPVVLPPTDEQAAIIKFVSDSTATLDALTAEAERGIELLQERRTALISAAVTGQIDVRGLVETEEA